MHALQENHKEYCILRAMQGAQNMYALEENHKEYFIWGALQGAPKSSWNLLEPIISQFLCEYCKQPTLSTVLAGSVDRDNWGFLFE